MNARTDGIREISLLPFLSGVKNSPPVGLSLTSVDPSDTDRSTPFNILHDSDPLTSVVAASFVTDSGCELKRVFLLLQKDRYDIERDELWPLTNRDIDDAWRHAFSHHADEGDDASRILLSGQTDDNGIPNPFSSLFFCKTRRLFFHPPCPLCGHPLTLCKNDDLLLSSGLRPYSGSTKRYLHCVSCSTQGANEFYVRELGNDDPETLHDQSALINNFRQLREGSDPAGDFPCIRCPDHDKCYGDSRAAQARIVPFSFYPFYLLIFDSMSLPALDFLPLISGASFDELKSALSAKGEPGRISCLENIQRDGLSGITLFPAHDERYFLEALFLKLSFLGDLLRQIFPQPGITGHPEMELTIDRIWVRLPGQSGLLPSFWNFRTKFLDIVRPPGISQFFPKPASSNLLQAGLLWFYALLVNKRQDSRDLMLSLKETASFKDGLPAVESLSSPVYAPEQIFWNPEGKQVDRHWLPLWEQSLMLGFTLLQTAIHPGRQWSPGSFFTELENLRTEVRVAMLRGSPVREDAPVRVDQSVGDENIHKILKGIIGKWRQRGVTETPVESPEEDNEMMETIILTPAEIAAPVYPLSEDEEWTETVVLSSRVVITEPPPSSPRYPVSDAELETVVLSAGGAKAEQSTAALPDEREDAMMETVIMTPGTRPEGAEGADAGPAGEGMEDSENGDDLPDTVILNPQKPKVKAKGWKD